MEIVTEKPTNKNIPKGYKQTEVGLIPEDWDTIQVSNIGNVIRGASPRPKGDPRYYGGDVPRLMVKDVTRDGKFVTPKTDFLTEEGAKRSRMCEKGTLTIVCSGTVGVPSFLAVDACIHDGFLALTGIRKDISDDYLYNQMNRLRELFDQSATHGGVFTNLTTEILREFKLPLPPTLEEQQTIAETLSDVDALIAKLNALIEKKQQVKKGAMQQLLTGKKRLPGFDGEWEEKRLGDLIENIVGGGTPRRNNSNYWDGEIPWATVKDLNSFRKEGTQESITVEGLRNSSANLVPSHTLITSTRMALGKAVIYDVDVAINQDLKALFTKPELNTEYLFNWFKTNEDSIKRLGSGSTVKGISLTDLKGLMIRFPSSLEEQKAIAQILSDMDAEIQALQDKRLKYEKIKQGMMQELLTGKTRLVETKEVESEGHNWQYDEAVILSVLVDRFGNPEYPLGRFRRTKLNYLTRRFLEKKVDRYLKKAAGPYSSDTRYKGPEGRALRKDYLKEWENEPYTGFIASDNVEEACTYFHDWYGNDVLDWIEEQFKFKDNDGLELITTVDKAIVELNKKEKGVNLSNVKSVIESHPEWKEKLERDLFSDGNIEDAIKESLTLFG